ncbi:MAG: PilZ domain-containing protein [Acetatifactor sp.]|nr:PilZ domain-containing protein [Acetatifactor sp.]
MGDKIYKKLLWVVRIGMRLSEDLRNHRIVIRDTRTGETVADTMIAAYDAEASELTLDTDQITLKEGTTISALIFSANGLCESQGVIRAQAEGKTFIRLSEGRGRDERQAVRYQVNIRGEVEFVSRPGEGKLPGGFEILLLNMSSIGLLIQAPSGRIRTGDTIRFTAVSKGQRLAITVEATRVEKVDSDKEKVGCSIQLVNLG